MCSGVSTCCTHLHAGFAKAVWSVSWNVPVPRAPTAAAEPPSTSSGIALSVATYIGVTVLVMAGPLAHTITPGLRTAAAPHE